jgi:hypothetical protein
VSGDGEKRDSQQRQGEAKTMEHPGDCTRSR